MFENDYIRIEIYNHSNCYWERYEYDKNDNKIYYENYAGYIGDYRNV